MACDLIQLEALLNKAGALSQLKATNSPRQFQAFALRDVRALNLRR